MHCIPFQYQLSIKSGLGNKENTLSDKQSCINFKRTPLVTFETVFFSDNVLPDLARYDEIHKMQVYVVK